MGSTFVWMVIFQFLVSIVILAGLLYGVNRMAMYAAFIRATPVVTGSAIYSDKSVDLYLQVDGHVHNAVIVEVVMSKAQVEKCLATAPVGFHLVDTQQPLCSFDRITFRPFYSIPPRDLSDEGQYMFSGAGHYLLWCGQFLLRHGPPNILRIPCQFPLDESPRIGIRYRYRVGVLMAEEYSGIATAEMST